MSVLLPEQLADGLRHVHTPDDIVASQPTGDYTEQYQPAYESEADLRAAVAELQTTQNVTTPEQILDFRHQLGQVAVSGFVALDGSCAEAVNLETPIESLVTEAEATSGAIESSRLAHMFRRAGSMVLHAMRNRGQGVKPRSKATEIVTKDTQTKSVRAGETVAAYMGDGVNEMPVDRRAVRPSRMVAMALQARDLEQQLTEASGHHVPAAHEALLLPYEKAQIVEDPSGKRYLLSADLPWIGARTNDPEGEHVAMLAGVENAVGVKISDKSDAAHIKALAEKLNPDNEEGKLVFMMRLGGGKAERLGNILDAIRIHAPNAIIMYDIHGVTRENEHGEKIRAVPEIIDEITQLTLACNTHGLRMSGVHLETMGDNNHRECVDKPNDRPTRPGCVDPRLNPEQLKRILDSIADIVLTQELRMSLTP